MTDVQTHRELAAVVLYSELQVKGKHRNSETHLSSSQRAVLLSSGREIFS